jgi:hypothetical protein
MPRRSGHVLPSAVALVLALAGTGRAELYCDRPVFQAGDVKSGAPLAHRFGFVNRGPEAVEVVEVKPSCGCLTPTLEKRRYGPGEAGALLFEVNTLGQEQGPAAWRVAVRCRAGGREDVLTLTATARVTAELWTDPASLVLYTDAAIGRDVTLIDARPTPLKVLKVETTSPQVRATWDEPHHDSQARWTYALHLEVLADYPEGRRDEALKVYTADPDYPELKVPFTVVKRAKQRVTVAPAAVELTAAAGQPVPSKLVLLRAGDGEDVEIEGVEADAAAVRCDWSPGPRPTTAVKVRVENPPAGGLKATLRVRLAKPAPQTVEVPVTYTPPQTDRR